MNTNKILNKFINAF